MAGRLADRLSGRRLLRLLFPVFLLVTGAAVPLCGQSVLGTLTEEGSGLPLEGALVALLPASGGALQAAAITDASGSFSLAAAPGKWRLRVSVLGHQTVNTDFFELASGRDLTLDLSAPVEALRLDEIVVTADTRDCVVRPEEGLLTAKVWEEARTALESVYWTHEGELAHFDAVVFERDLDPHTLQVKSERTEERGSTGGRPFSTATPESLAQKGFVQKTDSGTFYFAPDDRVLMSDAFLDGHCFSLLSSEERPELVGLAFQPVSAGSLVDIDGVLWLDRETNELRSLEYHYDNLQLGVSTDELGGGVQFQRLPTGLWFTRSWWIRVPVIVSQRRRVIGRDTERQVLTGIRESGAEVLAVETPQRRIEDLDRPRLQGMVYDSTRGEPLEGARVTLSGTDNATTTDANGRFELTTGEGDFLVAFYHPRMDTLGVRPPPREMSQRRGMVRQVRLAIPSQATLATQTCAASGGGPVVHGIVHDAKDRPVVQARVGLSWSASDGAPLNRVESSDALGRFVFCALTPSSAVRVQAEYGGLISEPLLLTVPPQGVTSAALVLDTLRTGRVRGRVTDRTTGLPLAGARVRVHGSELETITDADGRFELADVPPGPQVLEFEHLLYGAQSESLGVAADSTVVVSVSLATGVIELDPLTVIAEREYRTPGVQGFFDRMERGNGFFLTAEAIERMQPTKVTDVLNAVPGLMVACGAPDVLGSGCAVRFERARRLDPRGGERECPVQFFVDGSPVARELVELLRPGTIQGIEVYNGLSDVPPQLRRGPDTRCGVIAVWLKDR